MTTPTGLPAGHRLVPAPADDATPDRPRGRRTTPPATMRSHGQDKEHHPVKNNLLTRGVLITAISTLAITLSA